jgi:hypothetical protein
LPCVVSDQVKATTIAKSQPERMVCLDEGIGRAGGSAAFRDPLLDVDAPGPAAQGLRSASLPFHEVWVARASRGIDR